MKRSTVLLALSLLFACFPCLALPGAEGGSGEEGWHQLFDGKTLEGWRIAESPASFRVEDGMIVVNGQRAHLFYTGEVENHDFRNFEFQAEVKTRPGSNSGIYIHTRYQERGWPRNGYEIQVNNSFRRDPVRTGSLYHVQDVTTAPAPDDVWFTMYIAVRGRRIVVKVNGKQTVDYTEPAASGESRGRGRQRLRGGTFALQAHDPGSTVFFRNIRVKPLPAVDLPLVDYHVHLKGGLTVKEAVELSKKRGVKFGILPNCGLGFPVTDDGGLKKFLKLLEGQPVYRGMQAEGREWLELFSPEWIAKFDYVLTDSMTFRDWKGKRIRLWMADEVNIEDQQDFMEMYVDVIVNILNREPIDIYANATFLPPAIAGEYDRLWTDDRMDRVIRAAVKNDVALEINARSRVPSAAFIKKAKAAGARFSFGTNNGGRELGNLEYCLEMARECGLTGADLFVPRPDGKKPIQRKKRSD